MRFFAAIFFFTWFFNLFLPWWAALVPAVVFGAWLAESIRNALVTGFVAGGLAWFVQALYIHIANQGILSARIAEMLQVGNSWVLLFIMFVIGGLLIGSGTLFGHNLKVILRSTGNRTKEDLNQL
jgi:hypothetical protein